MEHAVKLPRKQQIESEATSLFKAKGYAAASMRDLAQILGIEAASLYSHVKSKEEILQKVCFKMAGVFFQAIESVESSSPEFKLAAAIKAHFGVISKNLDASAVFLNEWRHLSEPFLTEFLELRVQYEQFYIEIIRQGIKKQLFRSIDAKFATMAILSSLNGTHEWYNPTGKMSAEEVGDHLSELLIKGLIKNQ